VVAISLDPLAAQAQHARVNRVTLPALADDSVSWAYDALPYGMMGGATPGHTFIRVGPDGVIRWRAD
jgi:peroxiredoxin Q/BCP